MNYTRPAIGTATLPYAPPNPQWVGGPIQTSEPTKSEGGPSNYYDMPFAEWVTTNDQMEFLAEQKWGKHAIHLKDIFKSLCRWGNKDGTTIEYDTKKIIYYGGRILRMVAGTAATRVYLKQLLDDKQFK